MGNVVLRCEFENITVSKELYGKLVELKERLGFTSMDYVIAYLLAVEKLASRRGLTGTVMEVLKRCSEDVQAYNSRLEKIETELSMLGSKLNMLVRKIKELDETVKQNNRR